MSMEPSDGKRALDVARVVSAIRMCGVPSIGELADIPGDGTAQVITWAEVIPVLRADLASHDMDRHWYEEARKGLRKAPDKFCDELDSLFGEWVAPRWSELRDGVVERAIQRLGIEVRHDPTVADLLQWYPPLRSDATLVGTAIRRLDGEVKPSRLLPDLPLLSGGDEETALLIDLALRSHWDEFRDVIAETLLGWLGGVRGELMHALWVTRPSDRRYQRAEIPAIARMLRQVPLRAGAPLDPFILSEMSGHTRANWRRDLAKLVSGDPELRFAATEALLWLASNREDLFAQFAALEINLPDPQPTMESFFGHGSRMVAARAGAALAYWRRLPDPMEALATRPKLPPAALAASGASRTWLADPALEHLLKTTLGQACSEFAEKVAETASNGEENLVGRLLERLELRCETINQRAAEIARERDAGERLHVSLKHRVIGKSEEGKPGLRPTGSFSTDVTMIVRARRGKAPPFAQRATFVQAKRIRRDQDLELSHFEVDIGQLGV